jgi:hypothetical protein
MGKQQLRVGFNALNKNINSNLNNGFALNQLSLLAAQSKITPVRVKSIVLDSAHPRFKELGEWDALGTIEYQDVVNPLESDVYPVARPLLGNNKAFPLLEEIVYILSFPNTSIGQITSNESTYYISIVALWNHPHHNAYPSAANQKPESQQKTYTQTQLGNVSKISSQPVTLNLGNTFVERSNIHPLLPFEGDIIYEGRWGNSIRLGSTVTTKPPIVKPLNNWSTSGSSGDPIMILRNGQGSSFSEGWLPVVEDINNNDSSIYLASTQNIPLSASNTSYTSYNTGSAPIAPNQYAGKQIVLNSGRLVFNSTNDHILLTSNKSINLNTSNFNVDSPNGQVVLQTFVDVNQVGSIKLGDKDATEPLLYGNITQDLLQQLITSIKTFTNSVSVAPNVAAIAVYAQTLNYQVTAIEQNILPKIKSNISYTK